MHGAIYCHVAVLDAVTNKRLQAALEASDALIEFVDGMFDAIEREVDPALLDSGLEPLLGL